MSWEMAAFQAALPGIRFTIIIAALSCLASLVVGFGLGISAVLSRFMRALELTYTTLWRGLPLLVTLFMVFFLVPLAGIDVSSAAAVFVGLTLWGSANVAEIVVGGIKGIHGAQLDAGLALGFPQASVLVRVVVPQAVRTMLPSLVGILLALVQATTLASMVSAVDLMESVRRVMRTLTITSGESHSFALYGVLMGIYFCLCYSLQKFSVFLGKRWAY
ncbi:MAG: ABC transporter permease subunit [Herbaspirillum sp.]